MSSKKVKYDKAVLKPGHLVSKGRDKNTDGELLSPAVVRKFDASLTSVPPSDWKKKVQ